MGRELPALFEQRRFGLGKGLLGHEHVDVGHPAATGGRQPAGHVRRPFQQDPPEGVPKERARESSRFPPDGPFRLGGQGSSAVQPLDEPLGRPRGETQMVRLVDDAAQEPGVVGLLQQVFPARRVERGQPLRIPQHVNQQRRGRRHDADSIGRPCPSVDRRSKAVSAPSRSPYDNE